MKLIARAIRAGIAAEFQRRQGLGYDPDACLVGLGETTEATVASQLRPKHDFAMCAFRRPAPRGQRASTEAGGLAIRS
jgi:hypothetical protein